MKDALAKKQYQTVGIDEDTQRDQIVAGPGYTPQN